MPHVHVAAICVVNKVVDYYQLLHVQRDAPVAIIKASYRTMMQKMQHHPDLGGDEATAKLLNLAVSILSNPEKRAIYDKSLIDNVQPKVKPATPAAEDVEKPNPSTKRRNKTKRHKTAKPQTPAFVELPPKPKCPFCGRTQAEHRVDIHGYHHSHNCRNCAGALTPIKNIRMSSSEELRRINRQSQRLSALIWHQWPQEIPVNAMLIDFSPAGCALICADTYALGHRLKVSTNLFNAICQVCFCKPPGDYGQPMLGLEFITLHLNSSPGHFVRLTA